MCKEFQQKVHKVMSTATAETADFVRKMVKTESNGWGDDAEALRRLARRYRLSFWTMNNIRIGRAKSVSADVRDRIREMFVDHCKKHAARLLRDAEMAATAKGRDHDDLRGIQDQIRALAARLEAAQDNQ